MLTIRNIVSGILMAEAAAAESPSSSRDETPSKGYATSPAFGGNHPVAKSEKTQAASTGPVIPNELIEAAVEIIKTEVSRTRGYYKSLFQLLRECGDVSTFKGTLASAEDRYCKAEGCKNMAEVKRKYGVKSLSYETFKSNIVNAVEKAPVMRSQVQAYFDWKHAHQGDNAVNVHEHFLNPWSDRYVEPDGHTKFRKDFDDADAKSTELQRLQAHKPTAQVTADASGNPQNKAETPAQVQGAGKDKDRAKMSEIESGVLLTALQDLIRTTTSLAKVMPDGILAGILNEATEKMRSEFRKQDEERAKSEQAKRPEKAKDTAEQVRARIDAQLAQQSEERVARAFTQGEAEKSASKEATSESQEAESESKELELPDVPVDDDSDLTDEDRQNMEDIGSADTEEQAATG